MDQATLFERDFDEPERMDMSVQLLEASFWSLLDVWHEPSEALVNDIRNYGIRSPIIISVDINSGDEFIHMIAGRRRLKAAIKLGMETVPVLRYRTGDVNSLVMTISDNATRTSNPVADAIALKKLVDIYPDATPKMLCELTGLSMATYRKRLRLVNLPPALLSAMVEGKISAGTAERLSKSNSRIQRRAIAVISSGNPLTNEDVKGFRQVESQRSFEQLMETLNLPELPANGNAFRGVLEQIASAPKGMTRAKMIQMAQEALNAPHP